MVKDKSLLENLKENKEFKIKFIDGLNKLGFPLEFKIRNILMKKKYQGVNEGLFTIEKAGQEITKSFDINAHLDKKKEILKNLTINLSLQLIGDCKYSSDKTRFLFAIPDTSNPQNKMFVGPILTAFQTANYSTHRNSELVSGFKKKFGDVYIASNINDTSEDHITSGREEKDSKTPDYERIFNIVENTILPATSQRFLQWRRYSFQDYSRDSGFLSKNIPKEEFIESLKRRYYSGKLIIPFIITSKPILAPVIGREGNIIDVEEKEFVLYEHSVYKPREYLELIGQYYDFGVFVCNEKYVESFLKYIENLFDKTFENITNNIGSQPFRLVEDFEDIQKQDDEIQQIKGISMLGRQFQIKPSS